MRFLIDHDVYQVTIDFLMGLGHDVVRVKDVGLSQALDVDLLHYSYKERLVLVTRDKDFGALVFLKHINNYGVIFLRCDPITIDNVHNEFKRFLKAHKDMSFQNSFIVMESNRHRIRFLHD